MQRILVLAIVLAALFPAFGLAQTQAGDTEVSQAYKAYQDKNPSEAFRLMKLAAAKGHPQGFHWLGHFYERGEVVARDYEAALQNFLVAGKAGIADAQNDLGNLYLSGNAHVTSNDPRATAKEGAKWYRLAADQGFTAAEYAMGMLLVRGLGVDRDYSAATRYLKRAAAKGSAEAAQFVEKYDENGWSAEQLYAAGKVGARSDSQTKRYFALAAAKGHGLAAYEAAEAYSDTAGSPDFVKAEALYAQAIYLGVHIANYSLAHLYSEGHPGLSQNYPAALERLSVFVAPEPKSIGDAVMRARALIRMGLHYINGWGIERNYESAFQMFQYAVKNDADYGSTDANYWVGYMYENGLGRPTDRLLASYHYCLAKNSSLARAADKRNGWKNEGGSCHK